MHSMHFLISLCNLYKVYRLYDSVVGAYFVSFRSKSSYLTHYFLSTTFFFFLQLDTLTMLSVTSLSLRTRTSTRALSTD